MDEKYDVFLVIVPADSASFERMASTVEEWIGVSTEALSFSEASELANSIHDLDRNAQG